MINSTKIAKMLETCHSLKCAFLHIYITKCFHFWMEFLWFWHSTSSNQSTLASHAQTDLVNTWGHWCPESMFKKKTTCVNAKFRHEAKNTLLSMQISLKSRIQLKFCIFKLNPFFFSTSYIWFSAKNCIA